MARFALIPAAPVLLENVDLLETSRIADLRAAVEGVLSRRERWSLPVETLPPLAGLGGYGIDRGVDTRTGEMLEGADWVQAVTDLDPDERAASESAHPGIAVTLLHAHAAGVMIVPLGSADDLVVPLDLSVAATEDAPLAPAPGADSFNQAFIDALHADDLSALHAVIDTAAEVHAEMGLLTTALTHLQQRRTGSFTLDELVFDVDIHDVRSLCGTGTC